MIFDKIFNKSKDSTSSPTETIDYYSEGVSQFNAGNYTQAMEFFQAVIDSQPARESAYLKLAETYNKMGKDDLAKKALFALLAINPNHREALANIQSFLIPKQGQTNVSNKKEASEATKSSASVKKRTAHPPNTNVFISQPTVSHSSAPNDPVVNVIPPSQNDTPYWMVEQQSGNRLYVSVFGQGCRLVAPNEKKDIFGNISNDWDGYRKPIGTLQIPKEIKLDGIVYKVTNIGNNAFQFCNEINCIILPNSLKRIGESAFNGTGIKRIDIPDSVTEMADYCFAWCGKLEVIKLSKSIHVLKSAVLIGTNIRNLVIPPNVKTIQEGFFDYSRVANLQKLTLRMSDVPPTIAKDSFKGVNRIDVLVPNNLLSSYQNARYWQTMNLIPY